MNVNGHMDIRGEKGQTVIETIFMLIILITIFLLIAEVSRAWHIKNSLNNAARVGARVGAVEPGLTTDDPEVEAAVEQSLGSQDVVVDTDIEDSNGTGETDSGDTVTVRVQGCFFPVAKWETKLGFFTASPDCQNVGMLLVSKASMRYEID